jgi:hypothetical protein
MLVLIDTDFIDRSHLKLRNNSWKPYVYIVFTTGRPLCHEALPRELTRGKQLT